MKVHHIDNDIKVACVTAETFPKGIMAAHEKLHSIVTFQPGREYYGISWRDGENGIIYKAASSLLDDDELDKYGLEIFTIKKGKYICEILDDYQKNIPAIKTTFAKLLTDTRIAPDGFCLEAKMIEKDLWCMVKLKD